MKRRIGIAFQGGGAKVVGLVAAAEALAAMRSELQIEAISGSSAGSIAAILLAAGVDFSKAKQALRKHAAIFETRLAPPSQAAMLAKATRFAWSGAPVYPASVFNDAIEAVLRDCGINPLLNIEDVCRTIPVVHVIVSDIYQGKSIAISSGSIRDALRKSCAIPFVFGSFRAEDQGQYVDGGVFDNLPTQILVARNDPDVDIFAIGFRPEQVTAARNAYRYTLALLSSVVSHKVAQSKDHVGQDHVLEIDTSLDTLDFDKMVRVGLDGEYDNIRENTRAFFRRWLTGAEGAGDQGVAGPRAAIRLREIERKLIRNIEEVFRAAGGHHDYVRMTVDANSLENESWPDSVDIEQLLRLPAGKSLPGLVVPLIDGSGSHWKTECVVKLDGPDGPALPFTQFVINDEVEAGGILVKRNSVVLLFDGDYSHSSGRAIYVLKRETRFGFMLPLRSGRDALVLQASYWPAREISVRLNVPASLGRIECDWSVNGNGRAEPFSVRPADVRNGWSSHAARLVDAPLNGHLKGIFDCH